MPVLDLSPWRCKCGVKGDDACCQWRCDQTGYGDYPGGGYSAPAEPVAPRSTDLPWPAWVIRNAEREAWLDSIGSGVYPAAGMNG